MPSPKESKNTASQGRDYIGRFAPSPTGPLHFGSLLAALASFLDARANGGQWLLRVEDLDPPREPKGSAELILKQLQKLGLEWDAEVLYQSQRLDAYRQVLQELQNRSLCYACDCTREQIRQMGNVYVGSCRERTSAPPRPYAMRLRVDAGEAGFDDLIQGHFSQQLESEVGDFVIRRKDKLFAYQLAVVIDDEYQNISHVVRGWDLIDSTPRQIYLQQVLRYKKLVYAHIPIVVDQRGQKLSKQTFAASIKIDQASILIFNALKLLGQSPPIEIEKECPDTQLQWAIENWKLASLPKVASLAADT